MDGAQWTQEFGMEKSMAEIGDPISSPCTIRQPTLMEKKVMRPPKDQALNCPRCNSTNTKFCYYNNYSLTQPRYFCKTCRRYWTAGGTLRNVPVGGGSRKHNKNSISTTPNSNSTPLSMAMDHQVPVSSQKLLLPDLNPPTISHFPSQNPKIQHDQGQDLNLGFRYSDHGAPQFLVFPKNEGKDVMSSSSPSSSSTPRLSALNFMTNGNIGERGFMINSYIPNMVPSTHLHQSRSALFASGFPFQECKPSLAFPVDENNNNGSGYVVNSSVPEDNMNGTLMFTLGATKHHSRASEDADNQQDKGSHENNSNGYWNGMLGGGSW